MCRMASSCLFGSNRCRNRPRHLRYASIGLRLRMWVGVTVPLPPRPWKRAARNTYFLIAAWSSPTCAQTIHMAAASRLVLFILISGYRPHCSLLRPPMPLSGPIMGPMPSPCPIIPGPCSPAKLRSYWMMLQISSSVSCPPNPTMLVPTDPFLITQKISPSVRWRQSP